MKNILITGGTGLIGRHLIPKLLDKGYKVSVLSRSKKCMPEVSCYTWDVEKHEIESKALEEIDYIIHLAGANIGEKRWTEPRRKLILDSRVKSTEFLYQIVDNKKLPLKSFITSSAVGYYGSITSEKIFDETDPPANDFLGEICRQWEQSAGRFEGLGIRTVKIRTGTVLARKGGALPKMALPVKLGIGSPLGNGRQYLPWIHINDLCEIYIKAVEDEEMKGPYNAVTNDHKTNREFYGTLAKVMGKPFWMPNIPGFTLRLIFGKMSDILLKGSRVSGKKISDSGFSFQFPLLENALADLI